MTKANLSPLARLSKPQQSKAVRAVSGTDPNPEKMMILMFPAITLGAFAVGVVGFYLLPKLLGPFISQLGG
ncbi:MAG: hypothetical protein KC476_03175 [Cyanobacteria bacterium HKST-UBA06]|nr:hypothetical protein [Cyanobacteria bacterium HKST-UBA06]